MLVGFEKTLRIFGDNGILETDLFGGEYNDG